MSYLYISLLHFRIRQLGSGADQAAHGYQTHHQAQTDADGAAVAGQSAEFIEAGQKAEGCGNG